MFDIINCLTLLICNKSCNIYAVFLFESYIFSNPFYNSFEKVHTHNTSSFSFLYLKYPKNSKFQNQVGGQNLIKFNPDQLFSALRGYFLKRKKGEKIELYVKKKGNPWGLKFCQLHLRTILVTL